MDSFRDHDGLRPYLSWLDGALPSPSPGGASPPLRHADFADWLAAEGILSMSLNPDTVIETWQRLAKR